MSDTWDNAPLAPAAPAPAQGGWDSAPLAGPSAQQKAVVSANDNGEEAARALQIGKRTGIPASVVQSDPEAYAAHDRQQSAIKAVQNPFIAKYVVGNPMAAKVSSDDYEQLDKSSQAIQNLHPDAVKQNAHVGLLQGIPEMAQMFGTAPGRAKLYDALTKLPKALLQGVVDFAKVPGDVASGKIDLNTPEGMDQAIGFGVGVALGGRDISVGRTGGSIKPPTGDYQSFDNFMSTLHGMKTREEIDAFLKQKAEADSPPGALLQIEHAKAGSEALDKAVEVAQDSKTKARSPELFAEAAEAHDPGNVHIDAQKIVDLYGKEGKTPAEGDGLFGFVPDIAAKAQAAAATGGEVTIPVSQYIAHIDPTVHEGLKDSVRLHDDGVTLAEAEDHKAAIEAWHASPHSFENFDLSKIGTGEGAQVYGHGLYFAENKSVHDQYYNQFAGEPTVGQERFNANNAVHLAAQAIHETGHIDLAQADLEKKLARFNDKNDPFEAERKKISQAIKELDFIAEIGKPTYEPARPAQSYKVSIAADPAHFLDWDKPLSEQDPHVQAVIEKLNKELEIPDFRNTADYIDSLKMAIADKEGMQHFDDAKELTSKRLAEAGIPGIKYLDQGSRLKPDQKAIDWYKQNLDNMNNQLKTDQSLTKDQRIQLKIRRDQVKKILQNAEEDKPLTRNFVVFDDRLVSIKEKNGEPVAAMVEAAVEAQKTLLGLKQEPFLTMLFKDAKSVGITDAEFKKYSDKIANQEQAILDKAVAIGKREAGRRLTPEWKRNEAAVRDEVTTELRERGPFAAEAYFRKHNIDLARDPENAATNADALAPLFGFETGQDLLRGLESIETEKAASGKGAAVQLKDAIAAETSNRMEQRYGNLAANIAKEAREIALADHAFDVMADEVRILARAAGTTPPLGRNEMVDWAKAAFERSGITEVANWEKLRRAVERGGREAEKALLKGDFQEAFQAKQRQMLAAVLAKQSLGLQKTIDQTEARIDRFTSEETISGINQAYLEQIRQMLARVGVDQHFAPLAGTDPLRDFVADSEGQLAVAPWLTEGNAPKIKDMTVEQFRAFADSLKSMEHVGRKAEQLESARGKAELQNVIFDIKKELDRFPFIDQPALNPSLPQRLKSLGRKVVGAHLLVERMFDYTDRFDPHGPLTEWLDRPLRDSNVKELQLTEQVTKMLRELKQHTDASINERVSNDLIPDAGDRTGKMAMTRANLRQVMLNMGNWSNMKKLTEGFGVNEADLRRWVDQHARPQDVAWVNGVWKVFDHLKPEADAMQLRDTGVPADTIEGVPWDVKGGKLNGGYYPVVYDKFNSDIQGHMAAKNPVFDTHYVSATTPHGYTVARTDYQGALDLSGSFLASRVQGMIHDIAFREAIRNANKLISNQEFRTALAQKWGKEAADLLPSWLKDIANSHTLDDQYAQGMVRAMSLVRQNVVSTLIAYNPGTFIKHGFTAAVMSADRVGAGPLVKAMGEIGAKGTVGIAKDLLHRNETEADAAFMDAFRDSIDQGERGDNARQFILNSSAVMRNRQRQVDDSVRGAVDAMNKAGPLRDLADFRHRQMQYQRMAVAFSDGLSAMPTWLAAYKKAYLSGETHDDAVFIADKEVSRAHGSGFVGDQPAVTRIGNSLPGELARWFVPLYKFWNHTVNNNFQLAWDTAATVRGEQPGQAPEPGANAASIARRVGLILATIFIEEQASAALDQDKKGFLHAMALSTLRYFGGGFVGARELTNGLASGYEPSTGMLGTLFKAGTETAKDIAKATSTGAQVSKNWIIHTANSIGMLTGIGGSQVGKTGSFLNDLRTGRENPQTFNQLRQGLRTGHSKPRIH